MYYNQNKLFNRNSFIGSNFQFNSPIKLENSIDFYKKGHKIHIKKENRGKFTDYCGGKVTNACIQKGKNSPDPKIRKRATFAANARTWKHQLGGVIKFLQKISPKLVSKTKGRLLTSYFKPVKDFKTPYIFPGQLGWSPAETRIVWYRTNNPIIQESYYKPFREAWSTRKVKGNKATSYFFKQQPDQKFELVENIEPNNYSVHFKTDRNALSYGNKMQLFAKIADEIPEGALLSTYGSISKGGVHGLERFGKDFGFNQIGTRQLVMKDTQEPVIIPILQKPLFKTKK